jgi:hypothetical protein
MLPGRKPNCRGVARNQLGLNISGYIVESLLLARRFHEQIAAADRHAALTTYDQENL